MKLLLDRNLSRRVAGLLSGEFPGSLHVSSLGLDRSDDVVLWDLAKREGFRGMEQRLRTKDAHWVFDTGRLT